jgi:hypothetical protein
MCSVYLTLLYPYPDSKNVDGSQSSVVQNGGAWKLTNMALQKVLQAFKDKEQEFKTMFLDMCPSDVVVGVSPGATWTIPINFICKKILLVVWSVIHYLAISMKMVRTPNYTQLTISYLYASSSLTSYFPLLPVPKIRFLRFQNGNVRGTRHSGAFL